MWRKSNPRGTWRQGKWELRSFFQRDGEFPLPDINKSKNKGRPVVIVESYWSVSEDMGLKELRGDVSGFEIKIRTGCGGRISTNVEQGAELWEKVVVLWNNNVGRFAETPSEIHSWLSMQRTVDCVARGVSELALFKYKQHIAKWDLAFTHISITKNSWRWKCGPVYVSQEDIELSGKLMMPDSFVCEGDQCILKPARIVVHSSRWRTFCVTGTLAQIRNATNSKATPEELREAFTSPLGDNNEATSPHGGRGYMCGGYHGFIHTLPTILVPSHDGESPWRNRFRSMSKMSTTTIASSVPTLTSPEMPERCVVM